MRGGFLHNLGRLDALAEIAGEAGCNECGARLRDVVLLPGQEEPPPDVCPVHGELPRLVARIVFVTPEGRRREIGAGTELA